MSLQRAARACRRNDSYTEICRDYSNVLEEQKQWDQDRKVLCFQYHINIEENSTDVV